MTTLILILFHIFLIINVLNMQGIKKNVGKWYLEIEEKKPDALGDSFEVVIYENHLRF